MQQWISNCLLIQIRWQGKRVEWTGQGKSDSRKKAKQILTFFLDPIPQHKSMSIQQTHSPNPITQAQVYLANSGQVSPPYFTLNSMGIIVLLPNEIPTTPTPQHTAILASLNWQGPGEQIHVEASQRMGTRKKLLDHIRILHCMFYGCWHKTKDINQYKKTRQITSQVTGK